MANDDENIGNQIRHILLKERLFVVPYVGLRGVKALDEYVFAPVTPESIGNMKKRIRDMLSTRLGGAIDIEDVCIEADEAGIEVSIEYVIRWSGRREVTCLRFDL